MSAGCLFRNVMTTLDCLLLGIFLVLIINTGYSKLTWAKGLIKLFTALFLLTEKRLNWIESESLGWYAITLSTLKTLIMFGMYPFKRIETVEVFHQALYWCSFLIFLVVSKKVCEGFSLERLVNYKKLANCLGLLGGPHPAGWDFLPTGGVGFHSLSLAASVGRPSYWLRPSP